MSLLKQFLIASVSLIVVACASTTANKPNISNVLSDTTGQKGRECIYTNEIRGYGLRGNNVITIDARFGYYIATFRPGCLDMATSATAIFGKHDYQICGGLSDEVIMGDSACTIDKIFKFENRKAAFAAYDAAAKIRAEASGAKNGEEQPGDSDKK